MSRTAHTTRSVGIVGAGLVGSLCALSLAREGYSVRVHEARPDARRVAPESGRSVALVLSARGWRALREVRLEETVRSFCVPLKGRVIHSAAATTTFQPYGKDDEAIFCVPRPQLNQVLLNAAEEAGVAFHFGRRCLGVDAGSGVLIMEDAQDGRAFRVEEERLLAADGAFSSVRTSLLKRDRFDFSRTYQSYGYVELSMPSNGETWALPPTGMHVWPRGRFMLTAFPLPDRTLSATLILPFEGETSFASVTTRTALRELFERHFADALPHLPSLEHEFFHNAHSSLVTIRCWPWVHERLALIGDAAHAMVPFFGQGMNAGFEDCTTLLAALREHNHGWGPALLDYQTRRKPNCDAVTELSLQNFVELSERVGDPQYLLQRRIEQRLYRQAPDRYVPLYPRVAFTTVPYSEAQRTAQHQQALIRELSSSIPDVEERWESAEVQQAVARLLERLTPRGTDVQGS